MSNVAEPGPVFCTTHPRVETYLRCGRCERPICPRCLIQTPVGARCRACARLRRLPMYDVGVRFLLRGGLAATATAALGITGLRFTPSFGLFVSLLLGGLLGLLVSGAVSLATNRKRGVSLAWTTVGGTVLGALVAHLVLLPLTFGLILGLDPPFLFRPRVGLDEILLVGIASLVAYSRLR